jgi:hypothetical protein
MISDVQEQIGVRITARPFRFKASLILTGMRRGKERQTAQKLCFRIPHCIHSSLYSSFGNLAGLNTMVSKPCSRATRWWCVCYVGCVFTAPCPGLDIVRQAGRLEIFIPNHVFSIFTYRGLEKLHVYFIRGCGGYKIQTSIYSKSQTSLVPVLALAQPDIRYLPSTDCVYTSLRVGPVGIRGASNSNESTLRMSTLKIALVY